jgi:hypothetical protein
MFYSSSFTLRPSHKFRLGRSFPTRGTVWLKPQHRYSLAPSCGRVGRPSNAISSVSIFTADPEVKLKVLLCGRVDLAAIEKFVKDHFFWSYSLMLQKLHGILSDFLSWAESCPCHCSIRSLSAEGHLRLASELRTLGLTGQDGRNHICIMAGCRAPEMAAAKWKSIFHDLGNQRCIDLVTACDDVNVAALSNVTSDFDEGRRVILAALEIKLQYWSVLPWRMCALAHWDPDVARQAGREIVSTWETRLVAGGS